MRTALLACGVSLAGVATAAPFRAQDDVEGRFGEYVRAIEGLAHPTDVVFAPDGTLWVVEMDAHRASQIDLEGVRLSAVGAGELRFPRFIDVMESGAVGISDAFGLFMSQSIVERRRGWPSPHVDGIDAVPDGLAWASSLEDLVWLPGDHTALGFPVGGAAVPIDVLDAGTNGVFVSDAGNHRIQVLNGPSFGDFGPYRGLFAEPWGLAFRDDRLYVADRENHRIQVFEPDGTYLYEWGIHPLRPAEGEGALHYPTAIAISPDGEHAVVAEPSQDRLQVFRKTTRPASEFVTNPALLSAGVPTHFGTAVDAAGDVMVVTSPESRRFTVYDLRRDTPIEVCRLGGYGTKPGKLRAIDGIALSPDGRRVHVSDPASRTVQTWFLEPFEGPVRMNPAQGSFARSIDLEAAFGEPHGEIVPGALAEAPDGRLFVVDRLAPRVLVIDSQGRFDGMLGGSNWIDPIDVEIRGGELYVLDRAGGFVDVFDLGPLSVRQLPLGDHVGRAGGLGVLPDGTVLISDAARHQVVALPSGEPRWTGHGLGRGETHKPAGLCIDGRRRVILSDHGNHRLQVFAPDGSFVDALGPRLYTLATKQP